MAIRYTPEYNKKLYNIVKNFNQKVQRANKAGKIPRAFLPQEVSIRKLKKNFTTRDDLDRELRNLQMFSRKSIRHSMDEPITDYELQVVKTTQKKAMDFYSHQYDVLSKVAKPYDLEDQAKLQEYKTNIELLSMGADAANEEDLKAMERAVHNYRQSFNKQGAGYRGFLSEVEWVMNQVEIPKEDQEEFFKKIKKLSPQQFYDIYTSSDLVQRVYEIADSPTYGGIKLNTDSGDAKRKVTALLDTIDVLIEEQKKL